MFTLSAELTCPITHAAFGAALSDVMKSGVKAAAWDCLVAPDSLTINSPMPVKMEM
jgi:sugar fermentation stimulation protein A